MSSSRQPAVSIGLPVYNGERFLVAALASLLGQSLGDIELIISDNASTDATRTICEDQAKRDPRVRYYRNETNLGVMANFLRVPTLARADHFMWAAHDDTWSPNYLESLLGAFRGNEQLLLCSGRTEYVTETGDPDPLEPNHAPPEALVPPEELVAHLLRQHATSWFYGVYRRAALPDLLDRLSTMPVWGGDLILLLHCCLDHDVVGREDAIIFKRNNRANPYRPMTSRQRTAWQLQYTAGILRQVATSRLPLARKWALRSEVRQYLRRMVFRNSLRKTVKQFGRAALAVGRGAE